MDRPNAKETTKSEAHLEAGPPPDLGKLILEREIPSDIALVTPLIIRVSDFLREGDLISPDFKNKLQICLDEALRNAVIHGNKRDFAKKVRLKIFVGDDQWAVVVEDEGKGFVLDKVPDPLAENALWGEGGRGIHLMAHYMDRVNFYCNGRVLVMTKSL